MSILGAVSNAISRVTTEGERVVNTVINKTRSSPEAESWKRHQQLQCRRAARESIAPIFDKLYYSSSPYLDSITARLNDIHIWSLTLNTEGGQDTSMPFFKPPTVAWLNVHQIHPGRDETRRCMMEADGRWEAARRGEYSECRVLATALGNEFARYQRIRPDESYHLDIGDCTDLKAGYKFQESFALEEISGWTRSRLHSRIQDHRYIRPRLSDDGNAESTVKEWASKFGDTWIRNDAKPHLSVIMQYDMDPSDDLLATEAMTILGLVRGGLAAHTLQERKIIPINVISCFNKYAARVLQAYYRDENLFVFKSKLYSFDSESIRHKNVDLFLLYLAAQPVGNTLG